MYDGPENFYNLVDVKAGGTVDIDCSSGLKTKLQTDQTVWGHWSTPVVVLITCDPNNRVVGGHHLNNFVVWTKPGTSGK